MNLVALLKGKGKNGFGYGSTAEEVTAGVTLEGKTMLLTGCTSGIGLETMRVLSLRGAHVLAAARSVKKAQAAINQVGAGGNATPLECELSEPSSVRGCVDAVKQSGRGLDAIICNAGIMALPKLELVHGYEKQFFTNHMGHFVLVTGLLDALTERGRVVVVSSAAHRGAPRRGIDFDNLSGEKGYSPWAAYGRSKLANLLFARYLARRFEGTGKTANALHPGVIHTNLARHMNPLISVAYALGGPLGLKTIPQGAATQTYLAAHPQAAEFNGEYFADCNPAESSSKGRDMALAEALWNKSVEIAGRESSAAVA